jgi:hypothetical protein
MQSSEFHLETELGMIATRLKMTNIERKAVEKTYKDVIDMFGGRNRRCVLAGIIYAVTNGKYCQKHIVAACRITEPPLRTVVKVLNESQIEIERFS